jgi:hypothetical protein
MSDSATPSQALNNVQDAMVKWIYEAKAFGRVILELVMAAA